MEQFTRYLLAILAHKLESKTEPMHYPGNLEELARHKPQ
jgi:hypothetical protein